MARVTSDETAQEKQRRSSDDQPQNDVLGAGLPLLQRLKLLKEKEELEEKKRLQKLAEEESTGKQLQKKTSISPVKDSSEVEPVQEESEPEVIGAGLPLFARLRLLKAKEEKERLEREAKEKTENVKDEVQSEKPDECDKKPDIEINKTAELVREKSVEKTEAKVQSLATQSATPTKNLFMNRLKKTGLVVQTKAIPKESTSKPDDKTAINDLNKDTDDKNKEVDKDKIDNSASSKENHTNSNSIQTSGGQVLEKAFGKLLSKKLNTQEKPPQVDKKSTESKKQLISTTKERILRNESFTKAIIEGPMLSVDDSDYNITLFESESSSDDSKTSEIKTKSTSSSDSVKSKSSVTCKSENGQTAKKVQRTESSDKKESNIIERKHKSLDSATRDKKSSSSDDNSLRPVQNLLKVSSKDFIPLLRFVFLMILIFFTILITL